MSGIRKPGEAGKNAVLKEDSSIRESATLQCKTSKPKAAAPKKQSVTKEKSNTVSEKADHNVSIRRKTRKERKNSRFSSAGLTAFIVVLVLVFIGIVAFSAYLSYTYLVDRYENPFSADEIMIDGLTKVDFKVEKGSTTAEIAENLHDKGLVQNKFIFKLLSKFNGYDSLYKSGVHYLCEGLTYDEIMVILSDEPVTVTVTFSEGFTTLQMAEKLDAAGVCKKDEFLATINTIDYSSYAFIPDTKGESEFIVDGFLFPDTYKFEIDSKPETVIYKMLNRFNDIFKPEYYDRLSRVGLTTSEAVTIASHVEKETKIASEREIIARVYFNLRNKNMINLATGPVCNPGEACLKAVITMNPHNYLYYALRNDGTYYHEFFENESDFNAFISSHNGGQVTDDHPQNNPEAH